MENGQILQTLRGVVVGARERDRERVSEKDKERGRELMNEREIGSWRQPQS